MSTPTPDSPPPLRPALRRSVAAALLGFAALVSAALVVIVGLLYAGHRLQR